MGCKVVKGRCDVKSPCDLLLLCVVERGWTDIKEKLL